MNQDKNLNPSLEELGKIIASYHCARHPIPASQLPDSHPSNSQAKPVDQAAEDFARYLRTQRNKARLTQQELADKADLSATTIFALEQGLILSTMIRTQTLEKLAEALALDVAHLDLMLDRPIPARGVMKIFTEVQLTWAAVVAYFGSPFKAMAVLALMICTLLSTLFYLGEPLQYVKYMPGLDVGGNDNYSGLLPATTTISYIERVELAPCLPLVNMDCSWHMPFLSALNIGFNEVMIVVLILLGIWFTIWRGDVPFRLVSGAFVGARKMIYATAAALTIIFIMPLPSLSGILIPDRAVDIQPFSYPIPDHSNVHPFDVKNTRISDDIRHRTQMFNSRVYPKSALNEDDTQTNSGWTIRYLSADYNDDIKQRERFQDVLNTLHKNSLRQEVQIVVQIDGHAEGAERRINLPNQKEEGAKLLEQDLVNEATMDDPDTLASFIRWGQSTFPDGNYHLSIANHGQAIRGIAWDNSNRVDGLNNDRFYLTPSEIREALRAPGIEPLNVLHLDGCTMSLSETVSEVDRAGVLISSQWLGWDYFAYNQYKKLSGKDTKSTKQRQHIMPNYISEIRARDDKVPYTISALDISRSDIDLNVIDTLAAELLNYLESNEITTSHLQEAIFTKYDIKNKRAINNGTQDLHIDLTNWSIILQNKSQNIINTLSYCFIHDIENIRHESILLFVNLNLSILLIFVIINLIVTKDGKIIRAFRSG